jgi:hypothetical protein
LKFVLTYPMGKKRAKHHLGQLLLGLDYAYEEGRLAALDALAAALRALPPATVDEHGASFFAQLAMRCGNEASAACAARVKDVLATLLGRVAPETRAGLLQRCLDFLDAAGSEDRAAEFDAGQDKRAKFSTSKAPFSAVFHSFRLIFGRAIISRNGLEA